MSNLPPSVLRSHANPKIKRFLRLRDNRARRKAKRVIVDGWRETAQALEAGLKLCELFLSAEEYERKHSDPHSGEAKILQDAEKRDQLTLLSEPLLKKIAFGQSPRGLVSEFQEPVANLSDIQLSPNPLLFILDRIEKPGNLGAIFRTGDAAGVDAILMCECTDPFNPNAIRNSQGAIFHVQSASASESDITNFLEAKRITPRAARVESSDQLWETDLQSPTAIILGNEAEGLGGRWKETPGGQIRGIRIPMQGSADSLNVSITAAVISMEAARQRKTSR